MLAALKVKSTGRLGLITVKVAVTGLNVPGVKAGIFTTAFVGVPTTVKDCNPVPAFYQKHKFGKRKHANNQNGENAQNKSTFPFL